MAGLFPTTRVQEFVHSTAAVSSNAVAVALSATTLWVDELVIDIDDNNPSSPNKALFGASTVSPASYGLAYYPGDKFPWPFTGPIPVHEIYYYQQGGVGNVRWMASRRKAT